jgi:transposase
MSQAGKPRGGKPKKKTEAQQIEEIMTKSDRDGSIMETMRWVNDCRVSHCSLPFIHGVHKPISASY